MVATLADTQARGAIVRRCHRDRVTMIRHGWTEGSKVATTGSLSAVGEDLAKTHPTVILLDLRLPIDSGAKLLELIRENCGDVPVIAKVRPRHSESRFFAVEGRDRGMVLRPLEGMVSAETRQFFRT